MNRIPRDQTADRGGDAGSGLLDLAQSLRNSPDFDGEMAASEAILIEHHGMYEVDIADHYCHVASLMLDMGNPAEPLLRRAAAFYEKALAPGDPDLVVCLQQVSLLREREKLERSGDRPTGHRHADPLVDLAARLSRLASVLQDMRSAEDMVAYAEATMCRRPGRAGDRRYPVSALVDHAGPGQPDRGVLVARSAIWEKALGPEHPDLAQRLVQLARGLEELDLRDEAEPLERRARAIEEKARAER